MDRVTCSSGALIAALVIVSACAFGAEQQTQDATSGASPRTGFDYGQHRWRERLDALDLTPEQRQTIKGIAERYRARGAELARRASQIRQQFLDVSPDDPAYAGATDQASQMTASLAADAVRMLSEMRVELHAVLTDEQRQQLKKRIAEERARWDEWRARHKPPE